MTAPLLSIGLMIFLALVLAQLTYWHIVRPIILLRLRYALFEIRDRLRLALIRNEIGRNQPAYGILEELCNLSLVTMEYAGLTVVITARPDQSAVLRVQRNIEIVGQSEQKLREIFEEISRVNLGVIICNSPGWVPWIIFCILCSYWSEKARERVDCWKRGAMGMTYETS